MHALNEKKTSRSITNRDENERFQLFCKNMLDFKWSWRGGDGGVWTFLQGCFVLRSSSYTAFWQALNNLCKQERQAISITETSAWQETLAKH